MIHESDSVDNENKTGPWSNDEAHGKIQDELLSVLSGFQADENFTARLRVVKKH